MIGGNEEKPEAGREIEKVVLMLQDYFIVNNPMSPAGTLTDTPHVLSPLTQSVHNEQMRVKRGREGERERETTEKGEVKGEDQREVEKLRGGFYSSFSSPCVMT